MASGPITSLQIGGKWKQWQILFSWAPKITADGDYSHEIKRHLTPWKESYDKPRQRIKKQRYHFASKGPYSQTYGFSCSHVCIKKAECWRTDAFKLWCWRRLESSLGGKEIKPVNPQGNKPWIFIERTHAEAEAPVFWPPDAKSRLTGKDSDGKDWWQKEKGAAEGEMVTQHHWLNTDLSKPQEIVEDRGTCHDTAQGFAKSETRLSNWKTAT